MLNTFCLSPMFTAEGKEFVSKQSHPHFFYFFCRFHLTYPNIGRQFLPPPSREYFGVTKVGDGKALSLHGTPPPKNRFRSTVPFSFRVRADFSPTPRSFPTIPFGRFHIWFGVCPKQRPWCQRLIPYMVEPVFVFRTRFLKDLTITVLLTRRLLFSQAHSQQFVLLDPSLQTVNSIPCSLGLLLLLQLRLFGGNLSYCG